jgi:hypothetical protein
LSFKRRCRCADPGIEEFELFFRIEQIAVIMLSVEIGDVVTESAQNAHGCGTTIDANGGSALGRELALDEDLVVFKVNTDFSACALRLLVFGEVSEKGDGGFSASFSHEVGFGSAAQGKEKTVYEK